LIRKRQLTAETASENLNHSEAQAFLLLEESAASTRQKLQSLVISINDALDEMAAEIADILE